MPHAVSRRLALLALLGSLTATATHAAGPALPARDLTVELRQVEEGQEQGGGHYGAGADSHASWEPLLVQVRNGEKAQLRLNDAIPMQWTQSVSGPAGSSGNSGMAGSGTNGSVTVNNNAAASVTQALVWFDAGQSMSVQPKWPGGSKSATVELELQRAAVGQKTGSELPNQTRNTVSTTVTVPLAEWVTIAATGRAARAGVYSSESGTQVRRLLQIRVMAP